MKTRKASPKGKIPYDISTDYNDIEAGLDRKYTVICLFLDFEKAFDSVWKKGLMKKLSDAGVTGKIWKLINSFLFNRKVRLVFNGYTGLIRACR